MENLSTTLSRLMSERGIKSAELARKTGIGQPVIYRLMTGTTDNPQLLTLKPLANFFGVSLDHLVGLSPSKSKPLDTVSLHTLNNKLTTIKTISSVLVDFMPILIESYKKSLEANLVNEEMPSDILPLLPLNCANLLKIINQLQELLNNNIALD